MADGLLVNVLPDFDTFEKKLKGKEFNKEVDVSGSGGGAAGAAGGGEEEGGTFAMVAELGKIGALIGVLIEVVRDLQPIIVMIEEILKIISLTLLPYFMLLFRLLQPFLTRMIEAAAAGMKAFRNIEGWDLYEVAGAIGEELSKILTGIIHAIGSTTHAGITGAMDFVGDAAGFAMNPVGSLTGFGGQLLQEMGGRQQSPQGQNINVNQYVTGFLESTNTQWIVNDAMDLLSFDLPR